MQRKNSLPGSGDPAFYATQLRGELGLRSRRYAQGRHHVESYGNPSVIVFPPSQDTCGNSLHGNFLDAAWQAICANAGWLRRFDKVHTQGARSLPKPQLDPSRRWRELDSSMSSDALLMNVFCTPGVVESSALQSALGVDSNVAPVFGWKARVPLANGRFDRTEVDMRLGSLLVEAKLTESGFQTREAMIVEAYRDFDLVFDRDLLPRIQLPAKRRRLPAEFPENYSQEFESFIDADRGNGLAPLPMEPLQRAPAAPEDAPPAAYAGYQLIRNVLAAYAAESSFCVLHDERRPDLREQWFQIMAAVRSADMRTRCQVLTWQEIAPLLPEDLQQFLDLKYGIAGAGRTPSSVDQH